MHRDADEEEDWSSVRHVMLQNLPARLTPIELLTAVQELGFFGEMVYYHMPQKPRQARNPGYAFIGFSTPERTQAFRDVITGYTFPSRASTKTVAVRPAHSQPSYRNDQELVMQMAMRDLPPALSGHADELDPETLEASAASSHGAPRAGTATASAPSASRAPASTGRGGRGRFGHGDSGYQGQGDQSHRNRGRRGRPGRQGRQARHVAVDSSTSRSDRRHSDVRFHL